MGKFTYDVAIKMDFEDRLLAHIQIVVGTKLRRGECFFFTWRNDPAMSGRTAVWMHPAASLAFRFEGSRTPQINRAWIEALAVTANAPSGLYIVREPEAAHADQEPVLLG